MVEDIIPTTINNSVYAIKLSITDHIDWIKYLDINRNMIINNNRNYENIVNPSSLIEPSSFLGAMIEIKHDDENGNAFDKYYSVQIGSNRFDLEERDKIFGWIAFEIKEKERAYCFIKTRDKYYLYIWSSSNSKDNDNDNKLLNKLNLLKLYKDFKSNPFSAIQLRDIKDMVDYDSIDSNNVLIYSNSNIISLKTADIYSILKYHKTDDFFGDKIYFLLLNDNIQFIGFDCYIHHFKDKNGINVYRWINLNDYNIHNRGHQDIKLIIGEYNENESDFEPNNIRKIKIENDHICDNQWIEKKLSKQQTLESIKWFIYHFILLTIGSLLLGALYFILFHKLNINNSGSIKQQ